MKRKPQYSLHTLFTASLVVLLCITSWRSYRAVRVARQEAAAQVRHAQESAKQATHWRWIADSHRREAETSRDRMAQRVQQLERQLDTMAATGP